MALTPAVHGEAVKSGTVTLQSGFSNWLGRSIKKVNGVVCLNFSATGALPKGTQTLVAKFDKTFAPQSAFVVASLGIDGNTGATTSFSFQVTSNSTDGLIYAQASAAGTHYFSFVVSFIP